LKNRTPTLITITAYCASFYFLGQALNTLPVAVVYALWSGIGIAAVALVGWVWFAQPLNAMTIAGLATKAVGVRIVGSAARH